MFTTIRTIEAVLVPGRMNDQVALLGRKNISHVADDPKGDVCPGAAHWGERRLYFAIL